MSTKSFVRLRTEDLETFRQSLAIYLQLEASKAQERSLYLDEEGYVIALDHFKQEGCISIHQPFSCDLDFKLNSEDLSRLIKKQAGQGLASLREMLDYAFRNLKEALEGGSAFFLQACSYTPKEASLEAKLESEEINWRELGRSSEELISLSGDADVPWDLLRACLHSWLWAAMLIEQALLIQKQYMELTWPGARPPRTPGRPPLTRDDYLHTVTIVLEVLRRHPNLDWNTVFEEAADELNKISGSSITRYAVEKRLRDLFEEFGRKFSREERNKEKTLEELEEIKRELEKRLPQ
jgi:hypothetical protein